MLRHELEFENGEPSTVAVDSRRRRCCSGNRHFQLPDYSKNRFVSFKSPECSSCSRYKSYSSSCSKGCGSPNSCPCEEPSYSRKPFQSPKYLGERSQSCRRNSKRCSGSCPRRSSPPYDFAETRKQRCRRECPDCLCDGCPSKYKTSSQKSDGMVESSNTHSPEPSCEFMAATREVGNCLSRFTPHLCPWEADVAVSGTVRAHCASTADEVSSRLAGRFKAHGKRFTTDSLSISPISPVSDFRSQKLSLGESDVGPRLNLSRNNIPLVDDMALNERVKRIIDSSASAEKSGRLLENEFYSTKPTTASCNNKYDIDRDINKWADRRSSLRDLPNQHCLECDLRMRSANKHGLGSWRDNDVESESIKSGRPSHHYDSLDIDGRYRSLPGTSPSSDSVRHDIKKGCLKYFKTPTNGRESGSYSSETDYAKNNNYGRQDEGESQRTSQSGIQEYSLKQNDSHFYSSRICRSMSPRLFSSHASPDIACSSFNLDNIHFRSTRKPSTGDNLA